MKQFNLKIFAAILWLMLVAGLIVVSAIAFPDVGLLLAGIIGGMFVITISSWAVKIIMDNWKQIQ